MLYVDDSYDNFNYNEINNLNKLKYKFSLNDRFIYVKDEDNNYFKCQTPFLKILKPIHVTLNKKKTIAKKYLILETNDDLDINNQIGEFMFIINKIHEISQERIKENSLEWFNTEFDEIGLDIKVKRPINEQKESEFIKICIPPNIEDEISKLSKGTYVLCNIIFKGLKLSNDYINEEWEIIDIITQEKYDEEQNQELINNIEQDSVQKLLDDNIDNENIIQENIIQEDIIQENIIQENIIQEDIIQENTIQENTIQENTIQENTIIQHDEQLQNYNIEKESINKKDNKNIKKNKTIKNNQKDNLIKKINKRIIFNK
jgi:hypothetical protein